jgi:hypothetical protein
VSIRNQQVAGSTPAGGSSQFSENKELPGICRSQTSPICFQLCQNCAKTPSRNFSCARIPLLVLVVFEGSFNRYSAALLRRDSFRPFVCFRVGRPRLDGSVTHDTRMHRPPIHQEERFTSRLPKWRRSIEQALKRLDQTGGGSPNESLAARNCGVARSSSPPRSTFLRDCWTIQPETRRFRRNTRNADSCTCRLHGLRAA